MREPTKFKVGFLGMVANIASSTLWATELLGGNITAYPLLFFSIFIISLCGIFVGFRLKVVTRQIILALLFNLFIFNIIMCVNAMVFHEYGAGKFWSVIHLEILLFCIGFIVSIFLNGKNKFDIDKLKQFNFLCSINHTLIVNSDLGLMLTKGRDYKHLLPILFPVLFFIGMVISKFDGSSQVNVASISAFIIACLMGYLLVQFYPVYEVAKRYEKETGHKLYAEDKKKIKVEKDESHWRY